MSNKFRILFVCHGNICRSPIAHAIFQKLIDENNLNDVLEVESSAVSTEEIGNDVYPPAAAILKKNGIKEFSHKANLFTNDKYYYYNKIYVMDESNMRRILNITNGDKDNKIFKLNHKDVDDPWYTQDFNTAFNEIKEGCERILRELLLTGEKFHKKIK